MNTRLTLLTVYVGLIFAFTGICVTPVDAQTQPSISPPSLPAVGEKGQKKNDRPVLAEISPTNRSDAAAVQPNYFYEFTRPGFPYSLVRIEHDASGRGKISFIKDGSEELITDPISLSTTTISRINKSLEALNFLDSTEDYQHTRDYLHLGNMSLRVIEGDKSRTAKYNWTDNKHAKELMDSYRKIANEYTWMFEFQVARDNQPLRTPGFMDTLESYVKRNEIADPPQLIPYLTVLTNDERLPLMARNHAVKLITLINKKHSKT